MAAVAQPTGQGIACDIVPGNAADDPLYLPLINRVRSQLKQKGLLKPAGHGRIDNFVIGAASDLPPAIGTAGTARNP